MGYTSLRQVLLRLSPLRVTQASFEEEVASALVGAAAWATASAALKKRALVKIVDEVRSHLEFH
jgi:hypothetical protein